MPWLKMLHVAAIISWCGLLLYLPAVIAQAAGRGAIDETPMSVRHLPHRLFTLVATPAALLAIGSGSAIILLEQPLGIWLILKLVAVTGMVVCHVLAGLLIVRLDQHPGRPVVHHCAALSIISLSLILSVAWLVLRKAP